MKQRAVAIVADYLSHRPRGRVVRVMKTGEDDYLMGIEDVRDGRVQLIHSTDDLENWLESFKQGRCPEPVGAICGVCDQVHGHRDVDGEVFGNCIRCQADLSRSPLNSATSRRRSGRWLRLQSFSLCCPATWDGKTQGLERRRPVGSR